MLMTDYVTRAPRLNGKLNQWIQGEIKKGERQSTYDEAFNYFMEELFRGENLLNAKRNTQKRYNVQIEYDTLEIPREDSKKSTLIVKVG